MHSAVTHHGQWSGFFSPASDVVRAVWEEVRGGGASTWTTVCPGVLGVRSWGGGDSGNNASGWGWIMGCSGSRACLNAPCAAERVTGFYIVLLCSEESMQMWATAGQNRTDCICFCKLMSELKTGSSYRVVFAWFIELFRLCDVLSSVSACMSESV